MFLANIADISHAAVHSTMRAFTDDAKVLCEITDVNNTVYLQDSLEVIYALAEENNTSFNDTKFQLLRYGKHEDSKNRTSYKTLSGTDIGQRNVVKDLGVAMLVTQCWDSHGTSFKKVQTVDGMDFTYIH